TLPALMARFLNEKGKPNHFSVINFGENGFNSLLEAKYLEKTFIERRETPDLIIFYDGANDCFQYVEHRQPNGHIGYRRLKAFIESYRSGWLGILKPINAAIYASYTNEFIDRIRMLRDPVKPDSPTLQKMVDLCVAGYDRIAKLAHCYNTDFLLIWQPMLWVEDCQVDRTVLKGERNTFLDIAKFPAMKDSVNIIYDKLESTLSTKPYFLSLRNALCTRKRVSFYPDGIHLNNHGNEVMAKVIGELLIKKFPARICPQKTPNPL
ncbi:MAG: SGNH/GDSL hydrolase family protein, partial [Desulfomonilaceae bacterium]